MNIKTTIKFVDQAECDEACIIIRRCGQNVALCVSLRSIGDIEILMDQESASQLRDALVAALEIAR